MRDWRSVRGIAAGVRKIALAQLPHDGASADPAMRLVDACAEDADLTLQALHASDPLLHGAQAVLDRQLEAVWFDAAISKSEIAFAIAHELGHLHLHDSRDECCITELQAETGEDDLLLASAELVGYDPAQRREVEANVFALELLAPHREAISLYRQGQSVADLAAGYGIRERLVLHQLAEALVQPPELQDTATQSASPPRPLDPSQQAAVEVHPVPALVVAGPGSGKTHTLTARALWLLDQGVNPSSILALTFTNKAAEEMLHRIGQRNPEAAQQMWIGTFHAFGLDFVRRFWRMLGYSSAPRLLTREEAQELIEEHLPELPVNLYEDLRDPAGGLADVFRAIDRAKDHVILPEEFERRAAEVLSEDVSEEDHLGRVREAAAIYRAWDEIVRRNGVIEFGDLITLPVRLLEQDGGLRGALRSEFKHVLVDEFQDVNHASARLVKALAPTGEGLWVVGDARQAIYRFRGASPENVIQFSDDYPTARELDLSVNYRSLPQIVSFVSHLARDLEGENSEREHWLASRTDSHGRIELHAAPGFEEQDALLVEAIRERQAEGYPLSQQAVLVRSNREAERFAAKLEEAGVASLRTGDPLENARVRELLALVSFCTESRSPAAFRVGQLFGLKAAATGEILRLCSEVNLTGLEAAKQVGQTFDDPGLSRLLSHLSHYSGYETAATFLLRTLFVEGSPFAPLISDGSLEAASVWHAVYSLLAFAAAQRPPKKPDTGSAEERKPDAAPIRPGEAGRVLLRRIRRQMAGSAKSPLASLELPETLDGVRVLTMHGAKGLEFPVVYLPNLHAPARDRKDTEAKLPLPQGIIRATDEAEDTEENRLFFVAASRARDFLWMCVPARPSKAPEPHAMLHRARPALEAAGVPWPEWSYFTGSEKQRAERDFCAAEPQRLTIRALTDYERCPRQYHYRHALRLPEPQIDSIYPRLVSLLRNEWRELLTAQKQGAFFDAGLAVDRLRARWDAEGLGDTPLGRWYLQRGERAIVAMPLQASELSVSEGEIELEARFGDDHIGLGKVAVVRDETGALVAETTGGSANGNSAEQNMLALAMAERFPNEQAVGSRQRSITKGEVSKTRSLASARRSNAKLFQEARAGIGAELFDAQPNERVCPSCPFLFICPA